MTNSFTRRATVVLAVVLAAWTGVAHAQRRPQAPPNFDAFYDLGPDSLIRRGVPKGTVKGPVTLPSQVYPGVAHDYWVYVPAQYDGKTEVSLMVFNDGATYMQPDGYYRAVNVLDNLIYRGELAGDDALALAGPSGLGRSKRHERAIVQDWKVKECFVC